MPGGWKAGEKSGQTPEREGGRGTEGQGWADDQRASRARKEKSREEGPRWTSRGGEKTEEDKKDPSPKEGGPMAWRTRQRSTRGEKTGAEAGGAEGEEHREVWRTREQSKAKEGQQMHKRRKACSTGAQGGEDKRRGGQGKLTGERLKQRDG